VGQTFQSALRPAFQCLEVLNLNFPNSGVPPAPTFQTLEFRTEHFPIVGKLAPPPFQSLEKS